MYDKISEKELNSLTFAGRQIWALCVKNIRLYFKKGPVLIFGLLFPFFMTLTWVIGREISPIRLFIGIASMAIFFTSTAMSPVIMPWETREKGLERQITSPLNLPRILLGIILASTLFSIILSIIVVLILSLGAGVSFTSEISLFGFIGILSLMACVGSLIGLLISAPPTDQMPGIMTLANLVRFPLIFISGVFIPLYQLPPNVQTIAWFSPLTPFVDGIAFCVGDVSLLPLTLNFVILIAWIFGLYGLCVVIHSKTFAKRFAQESGPLPKISTR